MSARLPGDMWFGVPLNTRSNSLNLMRLILATSVLFHHGFPLAGMGEGPLVLGDLTGGWAVIGFFALSGYLIAASRRTKRVGTFLALRVARIFPAFIVCNLVTVLVVAPIAWVYRNGSLAGYLTTETTPLQYLFVNAALKMNAYDVGASPVGVPYPHVWNGSLWSLFFEFLCYLMVAVIFFIPFAATSPIPMVLAWLGSVLARVVYVVWGEALGLGADVGILTKLLPYFLAGAVLQMVRKQVGMQALAAVIAAGIFAVGTGLAPSWGGQATSIALTYVLLWLGATLKSPQVIRTHDVSYGMYIYAFQVQQLFAVFGAWTWGYWPFALAALAVTVVFAVPSWLLVERPIMEWARKRLPAEGQDARVIAGKVP